MKLLIKYISIIGLVYLLFAILKAVIGPEVLCNFYLRYTFSFLLFLVVIRMFIQERKRRGLSIEFGILFQNVIVLVSFGFVINLVINYSAVKIVDESYAKYFDESRFNAQLQWDEVFNISPVQKAKKIAFHEPQTIEDYTIKSFFFEMLIYLLLLSIPISLFLVYISRLFDSLISKFRSDPSVT